MTKREIATALSSAVLGGFAAVALQGAAPAIAQQVTGGWQVAGVAPFSQIGVAAVLVQPGTGQIKICRSSGPTIGCGPATPIGN